jgi:small-conductance mechanosensitive channel
MSLKQLIQLLPSFGVIALVVLALFVVHRFVLRGHQANPGRRFRNQLLMLGLTLAGAVVVISVLPVSTTLRGQLLSLLGILFSAAVALSSTTLLGNAMAGIMLRAVRPFRPGYFIEVNGYFGRVSEMGLFHTEIQTQDRDLITLPNLFLVTHPVKRIRPSGTMVSGRVSLGYDLLHTRVEPLLIEAARQAGLKDPFVRILDLGDHAVTYQVSGLLEEVTQILAVRSKLRAAMLDTLHGADVEIVSPQFQNERQLSETQRFVPPTTPTPASEPPPGEAELLMFDKAEEAASVEALHTRREELEKQIEAARVRAKETGAEADETEVARLKDRRERLDRLIALREASVAEKE